jgi:hypothetical protein
MEEPTMQDSGERRQFETGTVRDRGDFKPRPDLISPHANTREGAWLALGAKKYRPRNWEAGMPISECVASLARHLEAYKLGKADEDHMAAIRTNAGFILHYEEEIKAGRLPASLDDMPKYVARSASVEAKIKADLDAFNGTGAFAAEDIPAGAPIKMVPGPVQYGPGGLIHLIRVPEGTQGPMPLTGKPFTVYLCGPITGQEIDYEWREIATANFARYGIRTLNPLRGKTRSDVSNQGLSYKGQLAAPEIASRDEMDIKVSDCVLAHFPYEPFRQSIGSLMEMGAAAIGFKKPVILCASPRVFNEHLFCRNFTTIEPNFDQAILRVVALAQVAQEER